jgi:L,D-transpeptidase ErfK/SrfK
VLVLAVAAQLAAGASATGAWEEEDFQQKPVVAYTVTKGESVIGALTAYRVRKGDTLFDIARQHSVGYKEMVESNPGLDVWLPPPGTIAMLPTAWVLPCCERRGLIINIPEMRVFYLRPSAADPSATEVITYAVGLGRDEWQTPRGKFAVRSKSLNPTWVIPASILQERIAEQGDTRTAIAGGEPDNPLGGHRLALSMPGYAIHGTNTPWGVGMQVSHGCIRLYPEDIGRLFPLVPVGTPGRFVYQPVKVGVWGGEVYVEITGDIYGLTPAIWREARSMLERRGVADRVDRERLIAALSQPRGIPIRVTGSPDGVTPVAPVGTVEVLSDAGISHTDEFETADD